MNINQQDKNFINKLSETLAFSIPRWFGNRAHINAAQTPEVRIHANSFIIRYRLLLDSDQRHLLVKIPHRPHQNDLQKSLRDEKLRQFARDEYEQLLSTWRTFNALNDPDCTAVQPLDFIEECNAIVMLEVQGILLGVMLTSPQIGFGLPEATKPFVGYLSKACHWLRKYHDNVGGSERGAISRELMQARLDKISRDVAKNIGSRYQVQAKLDILQSQIEKNVGRERIAHLHGDFHASNILITHSGPVCALDPRLDLDKRSVYKDLATLLIDLSVKPIPILSGGVFTRKFFQKCQQAVIESYFEPGEFEPSLFDFYCGCEVLFKWSMHERDFKLLKKRRIVAPLARPILTNYINGLTQHYLQSTQKFLYHPFITTK